MSVIVNGRVFEASEILDELDASGGYDTLEWAENLLVETDFCARLGVQADEEFSINGDLDAGYDETSAILTALRILQHRAESGEPLKIEPIDRNPRGRLSGLAERRGH